MAKVQTWECHLIYTIWSKVFCSSKLKPGCHYNCIYRYKKRQKAVCCSLLSSASSMGRSGELTDFERGLVIGYHFSKKSVRDFATLLKLPKSMVGDMIVKWKREGTTTMKPRLGQPCLMTDSYCRALKKVVRESRQTSSDCASRVKKNGFHGWAAAHKPNISPVNAKRWLTWCKESRHWTVDNWKHVIWDD
jgi:transposase